MKHFAEIDETNTVCNIVIVDNADAPDEATGEVFLQNMYGLDKTYKECMAGNEYRITNDSDNGTVIRKQHPIQDSTYNAEADIFILPRKWDSWALDSNFDWQPPTPEPEWTDDTWYSWDEDNLQWVAREYSDSEPLGELN
tara:strand:- start:42 stop:461 length:420 start_codon:yes stop_codon:yes gene_type:complete